MSLRQTIHPPGCVPIPPNPPSAPKKKMKKEKKKLKFPVTKTEALLDLHTTNNDMKKRVFFRPVRFNK